MLTHRLRRWVSIRTTLVHCALFVEGVRVPPPGWWHGHVGVHPPPPGKRTPGDTHTQVSVRLPDTGECTRSTCTLYVGQYTIQPSDATNNNHVSPYKTSLNNKTIPLIIKWVWYKCILYISSRLICLVVYSGKYAVTFEFTGERF